jgi:hypothetical protein
MSATGLHEFQSVEAAVGVCSAQRRRVLATVLKSGFASDKPAMPGILPPNSRGHVSLFNRGPLSRSLQIRIGILRKLMG